MVTAPATMQVIAMIKRLVAIGLIICMLAGTACTAQDTPPSQQEPEPVAEEEDDDLDMKKKKKKKKDDSKKRKRK